MCDELFVYLKKYYEKFDRYNTTFCNQLGNLSRNFFIDCTEFNYKTSLVVIDFKFQLTQLTFKARTDLVEFFAVLFEVDICIFL